jgi:hypothetical protein
LFKSESGAERSYARRPDRGGRSTVFGTRGAVACEHPAAAVAGLRVLDEGGTAADACVAMAAAMAVVGPMATGMGGDAFLLFYEAATGRVLGANGSGAAPGAATIEKLRDAGFDEMPERGGPPITVPAPSGSGRTPRTLWATCRSPACSNPPTSSPRTASPSRRSLPATGRSPRTCCAGRGRRAALLTDGRAPHPARSSPSRTWPTPSRPSPRAGPTPSTTAASRAAWRRPRRGPAAT